MFHRRKSDERSHKKCIKYKDLDELVLKNARLRFCAEQLHNLNFIFQKKLQRTAPPSAKNHLLAKSVAERLVQRLVCGVGMLDARFATKFLIYTHNPKDTFGANLEYLVRLDCLSTPCLYTSDTATKYSIIETDPDYPAGYARIRLHTSSFKLWSEYTNPNGYLRRDKIQARYIELLAQTAAMEMPNSPLQVDESICCGIPGKIVDAATLQSILNESANQHLFYGPGGKAPRFPDPRDFRLAIVDEPSGIRIRIEFLSPALSNISINVRLLVAIGVDGWPSSTDFPFRISLGHSDCLLYHRAAQTGMYLAGYGVQSSAWQIRLPAAEYMLLNHYGTDSNVRTILDVLLEILQDLDRTRDKRQHTSYKILNNYILLTVLLDELESDTSTPTLELIHWSPMYLSTHVLKLIDKLILKLQVERLPNYFFDKSNLLLNPGHLSDEDYTMEAQTLKIYILRLFDESLMSTRGNMEFSKLIASQESEMVLLYKWKELIDGLLPPSGTRGRRFCFAGSRNRLEIVHTQYTVRQLEYIGLLLKSMLGVKQHILQGDCTMVEEFEAVQLDKNEHLEDVIYILVTIMDQARDQYIQNQANNPHVKKNKSKIKQQYNTYTAKLVELLRKDRELSQFNFEDDLILVKVILKWLYKAIDQNKRYLAPILRPYLQTLFSTSHSTSWHLDSIKQKLNNDELMALGSFCALVNGQKITPAQGLLDAVAKNWIWAKNMLEMVQKHTLRVVFVSERGQVYRHILSLPSYQSKTPPPPLHNGSHTLESPKLSRHERREKTMPNRSYFHSILRNKNSASAEKDDDSIPQHDHLKNFSPLTLILSSKHRRGDHRGCGDIFKALLAMQKINVLHEVTSNLPSEERLEMAELIHNLQSMKNRRSIGKKWSTTLPQMHIKCKINPKCDTVQRYTPKEESAGVRIEQETAHKSDALTLNVNSLLGTCRAARIKEDNSNVFLLHDSFKVKSLQKSDSFQY